MFVDDHNARHRPSQALPEQTFHQYLIRYSHKAAYERNKELQRTKTSTPIAHGLQRQGANKYQDLTNGGAKPKKQKQSPKL
eukprot:806756-Amphidinium_carterae.1